MIKEKKEGHDEEMRSLAGFDSTLLERNGAERMDGSEGTDRKDRGVCLSLRTHLSSSFDMQE